MYNQGGGGLKPVFSYSFPGSHLVSISLVKQEHQEKEYKTSYFCFITMMPGEQNSNSPTGRTFNKDNKITLKLEADKLLGFAHAVRAIGQGNFNLSLGWSIFADTSKSSFAGPGGGETKTIWLQVEQIDNKMLQMKIPHLAIYFKKGNVQGGAKKALYSLPNALAIADIAEFIGKKSLELEFNKSEVTIRGSVSVPSPNNNQQPNRGYQQPTSGYGQQQNTGGPPPVPIITTANNVMEPTQVVEGFSNKIMNNYGGGNLPYPDNQTMEDAPF